MTIRIAQILIPLLKILYVNFCVLSNKLNFLIFNHKPVCRQAENTRNCTKNTKKKHCDLCGK